MKTMNQVTGAAPASAKSTKIDPLQSVAASMDSINISLDRLARLTEQTANDATAARAAKLVAESAANNNAKVAEAAVGELTSVQAQLLALKAEHEKKMKEVVPQHALINLLGQNSADRLAERLKGARDVSAARKVCVEANDEIIKALLDDRSIEGKFKKVMTVDQDTVLWGGIAAGVVAVAAIGTVGYVCYNKGVERGHLEMLDAHGTVEFRGKR